MGKPHFFIEINTANTQNNSYFIQLESEAYYSKSKYRTNACFSISDDVNAYAVLSGTFLLFDNEADPTLVNLILQTNDLTTPVNYTPSAKYFVYRGLRRDDFMTGSSGKYTIVPKNNNDKKLIQYLYNTYEINGRTLKLEDFYYSGNVDNTPVHNIFIEKKNGLSVIKGEVLGKFKNTTLTKPSFSVILDFLPYNPYVVDLRFAKDSDAKIEVYNNQINSLVVSTENEDKSVLKKREYIHLFLDPVVYFGSYFQDGIVFKDKTYTCSDNEKSNLFYKYFIKPFFTKDLFYLDIRNFLDYSLNYFGDHVNNGKNLQLKETNESLFEDITYQTDNWPILIKKQNTISNRNNLFFNINFFTNNVDLPMLFNDYGITPKNCKWQGGTSAGMISKFNLAKQGKLVESSSITLIQPCLTNIDGNSQVKIPWIARMYFFNGKVKSNTNKFHKTPFDYLFGNITSSSVGTYAYNKDNLPTGSGTHWNQRKVCLPVGMSHKSPSVYQTGIATSKETFIFLANNISNDTIKSNQKASQNSGTNILLDSNKKNYLKYLDKDTNTTLLVQIAPEYYQLILTFDNVNDIQQTIAEYEGANPDSIDEYRFVFEPFSLVNNSDKLQYGQGILKLRGRLNNGNEIIIANLQRPSAQLFINTFDRYTFTTRNIINSSSTIKKGEDENKFPEFSTQKLVELLKDIHRVYLEKQKTSSELNSGNYIKVKDFISIWRRYYYGDKDDLNYDGTDLPRLINIDVFDLAIPNSFEIKKYYKKELDFFYKNYLTEKRKKEIQDYLENSVANENKLNDNPSPYIIDPSNIRIDLGHLLYGLDGLIHNYGSTSENFTNLSIYDSNDLTGYVADVFTPAAEKRLYYDHKMGVPNFTYPTLPDLDRLYEISAPLADLYSDVDPFGLYNVYKYFAIDHPNHDLIPSIKGKKIVTIDFLFDYYYHAGFTLSNDVDFPVKANYKVRWLNFCLPYKKNGVLINQGFIDETSYLWLADDSNHESVSLLRKRGESFAHFWYQSKNSFIFGEAIITKKYEGYMPPDYDNPLSQGFYYDLLKRNSLDNIVRFERKGQLSLKQELSEFIENRTNVIPSNVPTDPEDLEFVMNKFLSFVKAEFLAEKQRIGY